MECQEEERLEGLTQKITSFFAYPASTPEHIAQSPRQQGIKTWPLRGGGSTPIQVPPSIEANHRYLKISLFQVSAK
jgi:hypothetical protein